MADKTVDSLAKEHELPVKQIIDSLAKAGFAGKKPDDIVTDEEILALRKKSGSSSRAKRSVSTLKVGGGRGATTTTTVTVRKRRRKAASATATGAKVKDAAKDANKKETKPQEKTKTAASKAADKKPAEAKGKKAVTKADKEKPSQKDAAKTPTAKSEDEGNRWKEDEARERRANEKLRVASDKSGRRRPRKVSFRTTQVVRPGKHAFHKPQDPISRKVEVGATMTVGELANKMTSKADVVLQHLAELGVEISDDMVLDQDTAMLIIEEMGHTAVIVGESHDEEELLGLSQADEPKKPRPPIVTVMGHVDHGKTTLLDHLRKTAVTEGEAGGITQHIGAYRVPVGKETVTFLDTPGHAAFSSMRVRGANVTDIVVLVVAADDGVKEQTEESVKHARAAEVPIIVAINKVDKPEADVERVRQELAKLELVSEEWGGSDLFVMLSAKTGEGVDKLLETILLQAEIMEIEAPATGPGQGIVVEAFLDKGCGPMAMVMVKSGVINKGDFLLAGTEYGRVRLMLDEHRKQMKSATPSCPVLITGLSDVPEVGSKVLVVRNERKAREIATQRKDEERKQRLMPQDAAQRLEQFMAVEDDSKPGNIDLIIKADVRGSIEALTGVLQKLPTAKVSNRIISSGIGGITESDISLAATTNAVVLGFNVRADKKAQALAQKEDVTIRYYSIIYEAIESVKEMMEDLIVPDTREEITGLAEVREVFNSSRLGQVAGSIVVDGSIKKGNPIRVLRDNIVVYEGELESLRRFKDDVNEVVAGTECGIAVKDYNDVKVGDQIEVYERILVKATL